MNHFYNKKQFILMLLPAAILYTLFMIWPFVFDVAYSFTDYQSVGTPNFIGWKNYARLFNDSNLLRSIKNTLISTAVATILSVGISFFIAYVLNRKTKKNDAIKGIIFAPYVIPVILSALLWIFILSPTSGLLNSILIKIGLEKFALKWINGPTLSPYSFGVVTTWTSIGFFMTIWQAGLRNIDEDVIEASVIDGCTSWQRVWYVVLPLLKDTLIANLIFSIVGGLKIYEVVYMMTGGGPFHKSESIVSYMYQLIFSRNDYGYGMAVAVVEGLIAFCLVFLFIKNSKVEN